MILWLSEVIYKVEEMERQTLKCILMIVVVLLVDILNLIWRCHKSDLSHKENRVWDEGIREESGMGEEWSEKSKNMERVSGFERR